MPTGYPGFFYPHTLGLRMSHDMKRAVERIARKFGISNSEAIRTLIEWGLETAQENRS